MATLENPGYYERADFIASSRADDFFRWLDLDEYEATTGEVDSSLGWVGLVKVTRDMISTWVSSQGDPWMSERRNFAPGWYIVRTDDNGLWWGMSYGGECDVHPGELCADTAAEEAARADFAETELAYQMWLDLSEGEV